MIGQSLLRRLAPLDEARCEEGGCVSDAERRNDVAREEAAEMIKRSDRVARHATRRATYPIADMIRHAERVRP